MPHNSTHSATSSAPQRAPSRFLRALVPGVLLGAGLWLIPGEAAAAPQCNTKPAVCARLAQQQKQRTASAALVARTQQHTPAPVAARTESSRCTTKPFVCNRMESMGARPAAPPVTLAQSSAEGARCSSKPAVCARLRVRPNTPPVTLAADQPR